MLRRYPWGPALLALVGFFLCLLARFHSPQTGFTSLLQVGDEFPWSPALRDVAPYVYRGSSGYDGQFYAQIALDPLLRAPALRTCVDDLGYRARRIFVPACAWTVGLGQGPRVLEAYALANAAGWLLLGAVLLRWLPPVGGQEVLRWAGIMFSHGLCLSLRSALTDGPGLALLALGVALLEGGRGSGALAVFGSAILSRETYLLNVAAALAPPGFRDRRGWARAGVGLLLVTAPLLAWMLYVKAHAGASPSGGMRNFGLPGTGYLDRWGELIADLGSGRTPPGDLVTSLLAHVALTAQVLFLALRPRPAETWWRVGAASGLFAAVFGPAVWEGHPGAAVRLLLPVTVAFNLLVPRGAKWLPLLLVGNLAVLGGIRVLADAPVPFARWYGDPALVRSLRLEAGSGWYRLESDRHRTWCWSRGPGELRLSNLGGAPVRIVLAGEASVLSPREMALQVGGQDLWRSGPVEGSARFRTLPILLPPGDSRLVLASDRPPAKAPGEDPRMLDFAVYDLRVEVSPAGAGSGIPGRTPPP